LKGFLLDTNVLSALRRPAENRRLVEFIAVQPTAYLHVSEVTLAELRFGIEQLTDPGRRADFQVWLDRIVRPMFEDRVHAVTEEVLLRWLLIQRNGRMAGHVFAQQDALIAAVAANQQLVVVSRDETHFVKAGVPTLDPWNCCFYSADGRRAELHNLVSATVLTELPL
jgi:toxin FitB